MDDHIISFNLPTCSQNITKDTESGSPSKESINQLLESMARSSFSSSPIFAPLFKLSPKDFNLFHAFSTRTSNFRRGGFDTGQIQLKLIRNRKNHHRVLHSTTLGLIIPIEIEIPPVLVLVKIWNYCSSPSTVAVTSIVAIAGIVADLITLQLLW